MFFFNSSQIYTNHKVSCQYNIPCGEFSIGYVDAQWWRRQMIKIDNKFTWDKYFLNYFDRRF